MRGVSGVTSPGLSIARRAGSGRGCVLTMFALRPGAVRAMSLPVTLRTARTRRRSTAAFSAERCAVRRSWSRVADATMPTAPERGARSLASPSGVTRTSGRLTSLPMAPGAAPRLAREDAVLRRTAPAPADTGHTTVERSSAGISGPSRSICFSSLR